MNLFVYMPRPGTMGGRLLDEIVHLSFPGSLEVFSDIPSFAARVKLPKDPESVAIVHDPTHEDLRSLGALRDYLMGTRMLLILPDQLEGNHFSRPQALPVLHSLYGQRRFRGHLHPQTARERPGGAGRVL